MSEGGSDRETKNVEKKCPLCYGAGWRTPRDICLACGGYGTHWQSVDAGTEQTDKQPDPDGGDQ